MDERLVSVGRTAAEFRAGLAERRVATDVDMAALRAALGGPLPTAPAAPEQVISELVAAAEPGLVATASPCGPHCVSSGATASKSSSTGRAGWRGDSPKVWQKAGAEIANDVVLIQVLLGFGPDTDRVVEAVQREGTCWVGSTTWRGRRLMRVSVSNWATTEHDVDRSVATILRAART